MFFSRFLHHAPTRGLVLVASFLSAGVGIAQPLPQVGLSSAGARILLEEGTYPHSPGGADRFGLAVATGDFNGDGFADLASGIPGNDCDFQVWDCGSVQVRFGYSTGPLEGLVILDPNGVGPFGEVPPEPAHAYDGYGTVLAVGDFQNDGYDDLVVGVPGNDHIAPNGTRESSGAVHVHYGLDGSLGGIQWVAEHVVWQGLAGDGDPVPGDARPGDRFGAALAVGDFNGDGHDDLAVGNPYDACQAATSCSTGTGRGAVFVGHGHIGGLVPFDAFEMRLGLDGLPDVPEDNEQFGYTLAAGDFNGDGFDDLAIGVPSEDDVGAVLVVHGSPNSLIFANHWYFGQFDLGDVGEPGDRFGEAMATGDWNGDGFDDLAVGAPREDGNPGFEDMGQVSIVYGGPGGLTPTGTQILFEHFLFGAGASEQYDNFGNALVSGDFNADGLDDLAVGIVGENDADHNDGGAAVLLGRRSGGSLGSTVRRLRVRGAAGAPSHRPDGMIPDHAFGEPHWGVSMAAADFDGNGFDDLAIGAANRDVPSQPTLVDSGALAVIFGRLFADGFESGTADEWGAAVAPGARLHSR